MGLIQKIQKYINLHNILLVIEAGRFVWSAIGAYMLTFMEAFEQLNNVQKVVYMTVFYMALLFSIQLTIPAIRKLRQFYASRVRKDVGLSISLVTEAVSALPDDLDAVVWGVNCAELPEGGYSPITTSRNFNKRFFKQAFVQKLKLTNLSGVPILNTTIPCHIDFGLMFDENSYHVVHQVESEIFLYKSGQLLPGESITIFLSNSSNKKYIAILTLLGYIESNLLDTDGKARIKYTWEHRSPRNIELQGGNQN